MKNVRNLDANEVLELVFVYLAEVSSLKDYDEIMETLANMGKSLTSSDRCTVWIVSDDKKTIWTKVAHGMQQIELPINSGIVGDTILTGRRAIIDDVYQDKRFNSDIDKQTGYKTKSMMVIPMYDYEEDIIGAFQVINHQGRVDTFDFQDMEYLTLASTYAAEALVSARLTTEIEETQKEVVFTMGSIGESRSKETGNHVKRVAEYSKILALAYGMDEKEAELLKQASPMHDIGKIAIPDAILKKPGRFDENEREIMNTHAELGYHMIKQSKRALLKTAAIVAYEHHEKYDGTGYPRGLKGDEIHIYGRITALADVFDALGSDRVYKKAWDDERVFKLLKEERGKHFDPKLIDLFFENLEEILKVRETFQDAYKDISKKDDNFNGIEVFGGNTFLLNKENTIDAGSLLKFINVASTDINCIWLTHSHLDHIIDIAYMLDNYYALRRKTLTIAGLPETIKAIKDNFLNDTIWPDFSKIKLISGNGMVVDYKEIGFNQKYDLSKNETIEPFETDHTVKSCGYIYTKDDKSIMITADTLSLDNVIEILNQRKNIKSLVVECSFPSELEKLAINTKHLTPKLLFHRLKMLKRDDVNIYINHIKQSYMEKIIKQISEESQEIGVSILREKEIVKF